MTKRLYYDDPYRTEFDARVVRTIPGERNTLGVVLDETCFYPTSGGQPSDRGVLNGEPVFDVTEDGADIVHWLASPLSSPVVHGRITWPRRFDHMQQHTGQHILSQAFVQLYNAETVSFHLGEDVVTIDVNRTPLEPPDVEAVENLANEVIFQDRPVISRFVEADELPGIGLRKETTRSEGIRVVQVEGFDVSACGGTHVARAGEIGMIVVRRWERRGQDTRVEFLCGWRALRDYRRKANMTREMGLQFSVGEQDLPAAVTRLIDEANNNRRLLNRLEAQARQTEAAAMLQEATLWNGVRVVRRVLTDRDPQEVQALARLLTEGHQQVVALLAAAQGGGRLFFARSQDVEADMAALLRQTTKQFGGGGGGQPHLAQGGGLPERKLHAALNAAYDALTTG